jgi:hypothetical protein
MVRIRRTWRAASAPPDWLRAELHRLAVILGAPTPELRLSDIGSPFVWGLLRPALLWPAGELNRGELSRLRAMLAHELGHLRRGDQRLACLEMLLAVGLWWHPLFWFARSRMRQEAELCCDAWAVWAVPGARRDYAGALIDAAERRSPAVHALPALGARPAFRTFEARLLMILHTNTSPKLSRFATLPLGLMALVSISGLSLVEASSAQGQVIGLQKVEQGKNQNQDPEQDRYWEVNFIEKIELERSTKELFARISVGSIKVVASQGDEAELRVQIKVEKDEIDEADIPDQLSDHLQVEQSEGRLSLRDLHADKEGEDEDEDAPTYRLNVSLALPRALAANLGIHVGSVQVNMSKQPALTVDCKVGSVALSSAEFSGDVKVKVDVGDIVFATARSQAGSIVAEAKLGEVSGAKSFGLKSESAGLGAKVSGEAGQSSSPKISLKSSVGSIELRRQENR